MRFTKMHGIGNDYVYINGFEESLRDPSALATRIADRHTGVGGDGLILLLPPEEGVAADVRMRMFNGDGSEAEMCGNGVRCVCKLAHDRGIARANPMRIQTGRGVLTLRYTLDESGRVGDVSVDMGEPILEPAAIPTSISHNGPLIDFNARRLFETREGLPAWTVDAGLNTGMTCVSMGNPHAVFFCSDVARIPLEAIGPVIEHDPWFPRRINIHFVQIQSRGEAIMRTWERGSGITLACGTGACAVAVAGVLTGRSDRHLLAHLPGGDLALEWDAGNNHVTMTGPATEVFQGDWPGE